MALLLPFEGYKLLLPPFSMHQLLQRKINTCKIIQGAAPVQLVFLC